MMEDIVNTICIFPSIKDIISMLSVNRELHTILFNNQRVQNVISNIHTWKSDIKSVEKFIKSEKEKTLCTLITAYETSICEQQRNEKKNEIETVLKELNEKGIKSLYKFGYYFTWISNSIYMEWRFKDHCNINNHNLQFSILFPGTVEYPCVKKFYDDNDYSGILYSSCRIDDNKLLEQRWFDTINNRISIFCPPKNINDMESYTSLDTYIALGIQLMNTEPF